MTVQELIAELNRKFPMTESWPENYEVDAETYANCCDAVFKRAEVAEVYGKAGTYLIKLGPNRGLMLKGIELRMKEGK